MASEANARVTDLLTTARRNTTAAATIASLNSVNSPHNFPYRISSWQAHSDLPLTVGDQAPRILVADTVDVNDREDGYLRLANPPMELTAGKRGGSTS